MSVLAPTDPAARGSLYAVVSCVFASILGATAAWTLSAFALAIPIVVAASTGVATIFVALARACRHPSLDYDPLFSFATHLFCVFASLWTIYFFFARPAIGPFADEPWTVCHGLGNVFFGFTLFILIGATLGATYAAARRARGAFRWRRALFAAACLSLFAYFIHRAAYLPL